MPSLQPRYTEAVRSCDPVRREVARRQLARLQTPRRTHTDAAASVWGHVPLAALFQEAGNVLRPRAAGRVETGHEPFHGSRSGRCVTISPETGLWWCRACRQGGDAVTFVQQWKGWRYSAAAAWLVARFGRPAHGRGPRGRVR